MAEAAAKAGIGRIKNDDGPKRKGAHENVDTESSEVRQPTVDLVGVNGKSFASRCTPTQMVHVEPTTNWKRPEDVAGSDPFGSVRMAEKFNNETAQ